MRSLRHRSPLPVVLATLLVGQLPAQEPISLDPIGVSIARTPLGLGAAGFSGSVLLPGDFQRGGSFMSLGQALLHLPGVLVRDRGDPALGPRLTIRGAGSRANFGVRGLRVLVDGVPATLADGQATLGMVDLELAERIEVARGPMSALHGNGSNGVISIETTSRPPSGLSGGAAFSTGSMGSRNVRVVAGAGAGSLGGLVAASHQKSNGAREHSASEQSRLRGSVSWQPTGSSMELVGRATIVDEPWLEAPGALTLEEFELNPRGASPTAVLRGTGKRSRQTQFSITGKSTSGPLQWEVNSWVGKRNLFNPIGLRPASASSPNQGTLIEISRRVVGSRGVITKLVGNQLRLTAGVDIQQQRDDRDNSVHASGEPVESTTFLNQLQVVNEMGLFAQGVQGLGANWVARANVRRDRVTFDFEDLLLGAAGGSRTMSAWNSSISLAWAYGSVEAWLALGSAFDTPTTTEIAGSRDGSSGINDLLDPETSTNAELGLRWRSGQFQAELVGWNRATTNAILPVEELDGRSYFDNVGETTAYGVEASIVGRLSTKTTLKGSINLMRSRFATGAQSEAGISIEGNRLPGIPNYSATVGIAHVEDGVRLDLDHQWSGNLVADDLGNQTTPGWGVGITTLSLRAELSDQFLLTGHASNVLAHEHVASVVVNGFGGRIIEPGPLRQIRLGAEIRINN